MTDREEISDIMPAIERERYRLDLIRRGFIAYTLIIYINSERETLWLILNELLKRLWH